MNFRSLSKAKKKEGKIAIVTGANAGIGYETTKGLASVGVEVIMACRDLQKAETAKQKILKSLPEAKLTLMEIDLASLASCCDGEAEQALKDGAEHHVVLRRGHENTVAR